MTESVLIERFSLALARKEGWNKQGKVPSVARRLNNPLCLAHWKAPDGSPYPEVCGYVEFPNAEIGWRAGRAQCRINIVKRRLTWRGFFAGVRGIYRGFCPQDPIQYAREIMAALHVDVDLDTPIIDLVVKDGR